jgi:signal transduction histidine kinase
VQAHEGSVDVKSDPGKGSKFEIRLPMMSAHRFPSPGTPGEG